MHTLQRHFSGTSHISCKKQGLAARQKGPCLHDERRRPCRSRPCVAQAASTDLVRSCCCFFDPGFMHHLLTSMLLQSAGLLETVATTALRYRLKRHDTVETKIQCNFLELLMGAVSGVQIRGTGWESRAGLTARVLEASCQSQCRMQHSFATLRHSLFEQRLAGTLAGSSSCLCRSLLVLLSWM